MDPVGLRRFEAPERGMAGTHEALAFRREMVAAVLGAARATLAFQRNQIAALVNTVAVTRRA
jgi:hypothetical protein